MDQETVNQTEWNNPNNWRGTKLMGLYSSPRDSRVWVPKRIPSLGWTINFGHKKGKTWLTAMIIGTITFIVATNVIVRQILKS